MSRELVSCSDASRSRSFSAKSPGRGTADDSRTFLLIFNDSYCGYL